MAQYAHLSIPDPEWAEFSAHLPPVKPVISVQIFREQAKAAYGTIINENPIHIGTPYCLKLSSIHANTCSSGPSLDSNILNILETKIPVKNGEIRVKAYIPHKRDNEAQGFPLMVWMFGGGMYAIVKIIPPFFPVSKVATTGFVLGTIENDEPLLCNLAINSRTTCVCGDYRKAPEHPFPAAADDSFAVLKWVI